MGNLKKKEKKEKGTTTGQGTLCVRLFDILISFALFYGPHDAT